MNWGRRRSKPWLGWTKGKTPHQALGEKNGKKLHLQKGNRGGRREKPGREKPGERNRGERNRGRKKPRAWGIPLHVNGVVCGQSKTIYVLLHLKAVNTSRALLPLSEAAWWMDRRTDSATQWKGTTFRRRGRVSGTKIRAWGYFFANVAFLFSKQNSDLV